MNYISTRNNKDNFTFKDVFLKGLADDGGLFVPKSIKHFKKEELDNLKSLSYNDLAAEIIYRFIGDFMSKDDLISLISKSYSNFRCDDVVKISNLGNLKVLELFHGPTLAFKDFGARFMSRTMEKTVSGNDKELNILVATSGDTGSAVAHGFYDVEGINVIILYPSGKVSTIQEKQLTTLDKNIYALEIDGTFDDCQKLVKHAFLDQYLKSYLDLSSANSINIARLIPQSFYYFNAYAKLNSSKKLALSVPSGNFGNLTAGILAKYMGLPIDCFIASTNANKTVPDYLKTNKYIASKSIKTISNAMDVGNPSNIKRIMDIYGDIEKLKEDFLAFSFDDNETKKCISEVFSSYNYILDPHSAVGLLGLNKFLKSNSNYNGVFLGTAHPAKFADIVEPIINKSIEMPDSLSNVISKEKKSTLLNNDYKDFSDYLLSNFR